MIRAEGWKIRALQVWGVVLAAPSGTGQRDFHPVPGTGCGHALKLPLFAVASTAVARRQSKRQRHRQGSIREEGVRPQREARDPDGVECAEGANEQRPKP